MFNIKRINEDEFEASFDEYKVRLYNCKGISGAFINVICKDIMEMMCWDGCVYDKLDMGKMLNEAIREDWWDWRNECKVKVGNEDMNLDMCNVYNDEVFKRVKFDCYEERERKLKDLKVIEAWDI